MTGTTGPDLLGRADAAEVAALIRRSRARAMPWLPDLHTPAEDRAFFAGELGRGSAWGVREGGALVGVAMVHGVLLTQLYVDPDGQGRGVGSALLATARAAVAGPLELWVFARNEPALAFYRRRGFVVVQATDGRGNEEGEPDLRLVDGAGGQILTKVSRDTPIT